MKKKILLLFIMMSSHLWIAAQVTIGDGTPPQDFSILEISTTQLTGGLRLPQLNTAKRNSLNLDGLNESDKEKAVGLAIINSETGCYEYWNGNEWISLCEGQTDIRFLTQENDTIDLPSIHFISQGESKGPYTPIETKPCTGIAESYTFTIISGSQYLSINISDPVTGKFKVNMEENPSAVMRSGIIRITNNCSGKSKDILLTQDGNTILCDESILAPKIIVSGGGNTLCIGGALYLSIYKPVNNASYIWTLNGVELARGNYYVASQPGRYVVYVNAIGCSNHSEEVIVQSETEVAPTPEKIILYASNNGVICSDGEITLTAFNVPSTGTLTWYRNGVKTNKSGNRISLERTDEGTWFAVIEDGGCFSSPSKSVEISSNIDSDPLADPVIYVNGKDIHTISVFCKSSRLNIELYNKSAYTTGITVKWYNGPTYLGEGTGISITAPSQDVLTLRCVVSDNTNTFCNGETVASTLLSGTAPATPSIVGNPIICGGSPAVLQISTTGNSYIWYKNGEVIPGQTSSSLGVIETGSYQVEVQDTSGCISPKSPPVAVSLSDFPVLTWRATYETAVPGATRTFQVSGSFSPTKYVWNADGGAKVVNAQAETASIEFPATAPATVHVTVQATNACGNSDLLTQEVTVAEKCLDAKIRNTDITPKGDVILGTKINMTVSATGVAPLKYEWYKDNVLVATTTEPDYSIESAKTTDSGTYYVHVTASCGLQETAEAVVGKLNVIDVTATEPGDGKGILKGENCFDIAESNDNSSCGQLTLRKQYQADFTKLYEYTFTSTSNGNTGLKFIVDDPESAIDSMAIDDLPGTLVNGGKYKVTIKYKESLSTILEGRTNDNPLKVHIYALFTNSIKIYSQQLTVNIKDCDCCSSVSDIEGNVYTTHRFGEAGCWMTQNLYSTRNSLSTFEKGYDMYGTAYNLVKPYYYVADTNDPIRTTFYNFSLVMNGATPTTGKVKDQYSSVQGPCPDGWVVPSDYEFFQLMQVINANPSDYSTSSQVTNISNDEYIKDKSFGGTTGTSALPMKSPGTYSNVAAGGASFTDGSGFNAELTGVWINRTIGGSFVWNIAGAGTEYWTSNKQDGNRIEGIAWLFANFNSQVERVSPTPRFHLSIRCKRKE